MEANDGLDGVMNLRATAELDRPRTYIPLVPTVLAVFECSSMTSEIHNRPLANRTSVR